MGISDPEELLREYGRRVNRHDFAEVAPLIDPSALYWFSDGSAHEGLAEIRAAFEHNWRVIQREVYRIEDVRWVVRGPEIAVCAYRFRWEGETRTGPRSAEGRGTSVLRRTDAGWRILLEHLSRPAP